MTRTTTTFGPSGQAMNEMNVNLLLFLERTLFKDQIVPIGVSSPFFFQPACSAAAGWSDFFYPRPHTGGRLRLVMQL